MRSNNFDFLRLIFALFVVLTHSFLLTGLGTPDWGLQLTGGQLSLGRCGLAGFFVISGFLVYQSLQRSRSFTHYLWKRFLRIFPGLCIMLVLTVLLGVFVYESSLRDYIRNRSVWTYVPRNLSLVFLQNRIQGIFTDNPYPGMINGPLWTIRWEMACYVALASLRLFPARSGRLLLGLAIGSLLLTRFFFDHALTTLPASISGPMSLVLDFFCGSLLASLNLESWSNSRKRWLLVASLAGLIASLAGGCFSSLEWLTLGPLVILFGTSGTPGVNSIGRRIGDLSYGVYIYSFPTQQVLMHFFHFSYWRLMLASVPLSLFFGYASWHLIEKRALRLKSHLPGRLSRETREVSVGLGNSESAVTPAGDAAQVTKPVDVLSAKGS